jgi:hypothetical protein
MVFFLVGFNSQASLGDLDLFLKSLLSCIAAVAGLMSTAVMQLFSSLLPKDARLFCF